jgi:microcystin-dependent protein
MDPFVAEIRIFPFNFPPKGWAFCDGQVLPISQNTALFSLLGTTYGGDGKSTFALPNLQGRGAMHPGQGQGLTLRDLGEEGGTETVTLLQSEIPFHTHALRARNNVAGGQSSPLNAVPALGAWVSGTKTGVVQTYTTGTSNLVPMDPGALAIAGGSLPHTNMQPYLTMNFCIALQGVFPPRP